MSDTDAEVPELPSLALILAQVGSERETTNSHAESLDTKAGVVLGFAGVLVGLAATVPPSDAHRLAFHVGLGMGVLAAVLGAAAFFPRRYPVLEPAVLRQFLASREDETRLALLDTQIDMIEDIASLVKRKGRRVQLAVIALTIAAAMVVVGTLVAGGANHA